MNTNSRKIIYTRIGNFHMFATAREDTNAVCCRQRNGKNGQNVKYLDFDWISSFIDIWLLFIWNGCHIDLNIIYAFLCISNRMNVSKRSSFLQHPDNRQSSTGTRICECIENYKTQIEWALWEKKTCLTKVSTVSVCHKPIWIWFGLDNKSDDRTKIP